MSQVLFTEAFTSFCHKSEWNHGLFTPKAPLPLPPYVAEVCTVFLFPLSALFFALAVVCLMLPFFLA